MREPSGLRRNPDPLESSADPGTEDGFSTDQATIDLIAVILALLAAAGVSLWLKPWSSIGVQGPDHLTVDGITSLLVLSPLVTAIFARRRYSESMRIRQELTRLSMSDTVTTLSNAMLLDAWIDEAIADALATDRYASVLFIDLDRFKVVNDTFGHDVGSRTLREVGQRLRSECPDDARLVRFGGDEFIVIRVFSQPTEPVGLARDLVEELGRPMKVEGKQIQVGCSIGIAIAGRGSTARSMFVEADSAMYSAKRSGGSDFSAAPRAAEIVRATLRDGDRPS